MPKTRLTAEERDRITRFRAGFNVVEQLIRKRFNRSQKNLFDLIDTLASIHREWKRRESLKLLANLRNEIAHAEGTDDLRAVPTEAAIAELKAVLKSVQWLDAVGQRFGGKVQCVASTDDLAHVLRLVRLRDYSQFPVVDGAKLHGLVTENGITRWLAENAGTDAIHSLGSVRVGDLVKSDENRRAYEMVPVRMSVEAAIARMSGQPDLEALLITKNGASLPLQGIVTRWDVLQVLRE